LDTPGVVMARQGSADMAEIALRNALRIDSLSDPIEPVEAILRRCQKDSLLLQYNIPDFTTTTEFLTLIAQKMGKLKKGGILDIVAAARKVLNDWNSGKIRYYTEPPEQYNVSSVVSSELVTEMAKEFSLDDFDASATLEAGFDNSDRFSHKITGGSTA